MLDEVDYDTITLHGHKRIFVQMASLKQVGSDAHMRENTRPALSNKKDDEDMKSIKIGEKKKSGAKAKKQVATLVVGRDIALAEAPDYLSFALVGRFCGKSVGEEALRKWMEEHWNTHLWKLPMFHILSRGWILF